LLSAILSLFFFVFLLKKKKKKKSGCRELSGMQENFGRKEKESGIGKSKKVILKDRVAWVCI
jgi:hypothetical protein